MATITAEMLRDLLQSARAAGGGPELDIVAHPDRAREFHALPEMIASLGPTIAPADLFKRLEPLPQRRCIGVYAGCVVWVDPECPPGHVYVPPPGGE